MKQSFLTAIAVSLFSVNAFAIAPELTITTESKFTISTPDVARKFEDTLLETEGFLKRFAPVDVKVKKKSVLGNTFDYAVEKKFLGMSMEVELVGSVTFERVATGCLANEDAYMGTFEFTADDTVVKYIDSLKMLICALEKSPNSLSVRTKNVLYYKGDKLSFFTEKYVTGVLKDQVAALNDAMKAETVAR